jgi:hypothetical protein
MKTKLALYTAILMMLVSGAAYATVSTNCGGGGGGTNYTYSECVTYGTGLANVYTFTPKDADLMELDHTKFYYWAIDTSKAASEKGFTASDIIGAEIFFNDITNWDNLRNWLYVNLVDGKPRYIDYNNDGNFTYMSGGNVYTDSGENIGAGTTVGGDAWSWSDNQGGGNNFAHNLWDINKNPISHLFLPRDTVNGTSVTWTDKNGYPTTDDVTITLTATELLTLMNFLSDNVAGIGFDPDCHFYNKDIQLKIYTECEVPEPGMLPLLLTSALAGLAFIRKRK